MEFNKMPIKKYTKHISKATHHHNGISGVFSKYENEPVLQEALKNVDELLLFNTIDTHADWVLICDRIGENVSYKSAAVSWKSYIARIAALFFLTAGLSWGVYQIISTHQDNKAGIITVVADHQIKDVYLPDGTVVTLNAGSSLSYCHDFGQVTRDVKLVGEAFFDVVHIASLPFRISVNASVVEVLGTKFSVCQSTDKVKVSVISGRVLLFSADSAQNKISIASHQSGYMLSNRMLKIENGISRNVLSWKTGHLIFNQTPIDSVLIDVAQYFRKELIQESTVKEEITAEFQDQPLREILEEIKLVAGIHIDTTENALIVRR
jgi:ferric-dicitrate binding protein FerR (iron transport regulator)